MSHAVALRRMAQDYVIDLYLRPPVWHYRLMDYHLMDPHRQVVQPVRFGKIVLLLSDVLPQVP